MDVGFGRVLGRVSACSSRTQKLFFSSPRTARHKGADASSRVATSAAKEVEGRVGFRAKVKMTKARGKVKGGGHPRQ